MEVNDVIKKIIDKRLNKHELYSIVCTVDSVDLADRTCTCTPINGGAELQDVRIQASIGSAVGLFIEPAEDSQVVVTFFNKETAFISLFSEIENVYLDFNDKVTFNGGANGAMVKIGDLVTRMNLIENRINTLNTAHNSHVHTETGATTTVPTVLLGGSLTPTVSTDIDNPDILQ